MVKTVTELGFVPGWSVDAMCKLMADVPEYQVNPEWAFNESKIWALGYIECKICARKGMAFYPADVDETSLECRDCEARNSRVLGWLHPNGSWVANDYEVEDWQAEQYFGD